MCGSQSTDAAVGHAVVVVLVKDERDGVAVALLRGHEVGVAVVEGVVVAYGSVDVGMVEHEGKGLPQRVGGGEMENGLTGSGEMLMV